MNNPYTLLQSPISNKPLALKIDGNGLATLTAENESYPIRNNIPIFFSSESIEGYNEKYMKFYNKIAFLYRLSAKFSTKKRMDELLGSLELMNNDKVLEVSVGTGNNMNYLVQKYQNLELYGLDISSGMLTQCQKVMKKYPIALVQGNGEALPYKDNSFNIVFHVGGINFFNNKKAAINEMIRVAKPNTQITIVDETSKWVKKVYQKLPVVSNYYQEMDNLGQTDAPIHLLPSTVSDIKLELIWNGGMYKLSFRK